MKSLFGSQLKVFQEILKTYGDLKIVNGEMDFQPKTIDQSSSIELFYRIIFSHMPSPVGESKQFAWDVLKKMNRKDTQDITDKTIDDIKDYFEQISNEAK